MPLDARREGMTRPVIVEFVGIAGSGKTSISRELVALLEARGYTVGYSSAARGWHLGLAALWRPRAIIAWMRTIRRVIELPEIRRELMRKMFTILGRVVSLARGNQVVVMDEGILHRFRAVRRSAAVADLSIAEAAKPISVVSLFPFEPSLIVLVQTDVEATAFRLHARDGRNVKHTASDISRSDERSQRDIAQVLAAFPGASMMTAANRTPEDVTMRAAEIATRVEGIVARQPSS